MVRRVPRAIALVATMLLGGLGLSPALLEAATFQGTVVDGETAEPLEGALVIVIWWREGGHAAGHAQPIAYHVAEQITDVRGRFAADVSPGLLSLVFQRRDVLVYKPGYRPLRDTSRDPRAPLLSQTVVGLTKARTPQEARAYAGSDHLHLHMCPSELLSAGCVRTTQVPRLIRVLEIQRRIFDPSPAGFEGEGDEP